MNEIERKAAEVQLGVLKLQHLLLKSQIQGDLPGHPFRGNQFSGGGGSGGNSISREQATQGIIQHFRETRPGSTVNSVKPAGSEDGHFWVQATSKRGNRYTTHARVQLFVDETGKRSMEITDAAQAAWTRVDL
jgi:hypothetical protein